MTNIVRLLSVAPILIMYHILHMRRCHPAARAWNLQKWLKQLRETVVEGQRLRTVHIMERTFSRLRFFRENEQYSDTDMYMQM